MSANQFKNSRQGHIPLTTTRDPNSCRHRPVERHRGDARTAAQASQTYRSRTAVLDRLTARVPPSEPLMAFLLKPSGRLGRAGDKPLKSADLRPFRQGSCSAVSLSDRCCVSWEPPGCSYSGIVSKDRGSSFHAARGEIIIIFDNWRKILLGMDPLLDHELMAICPPFSLRQPFPVALGSAPLLQGWLVG